MSYTEYLSLALDCAKSCAEFFKEGFYTINSIEWKSDSDPVTMYDKKIEQLSRDFILSKYPHHLILGEEDGLGENINSDYQWILDPIDGTINYIRGIPIVSYSLALIYQGEIVVSVVANPILDEYFWAVRGQGAFLNGKEIKVSTGSHLKQSYLMLGSYNEEYSKIYHHYIKKFQCVRNLGSAALALAYVASGRIDGLLYFRLSPWDVAGGILLVRESGGKVNNINSEVFSLDKVSIVASSPYIHNAIIEPLTDLTQFF